jgi:hypothetical protein
VFLAVGPPAPANSLTLDPLCPDTYHPRPVPLPTLTGLLISIYTYLPARPLPTPSPLPSPTPASLFHSQPTHAHFTRPPLSRPSFLAVTTAPCKTNVCRLRLVHDTRPLIVYLSPHSNPSQNGIAAFLSLGTLAQPTALHYQATQQLHALHRSPGMLDTGGSPYAGRGHCCRP